MVAPPLIEYRDVKTNNSQDVEASEQTRLASALLDLVLDKLRANGFSARALLPTELTALPPSATTWALCDATTSFRLVCLRGRFYVGPGFVYEPVFGTLRSSASRIVLEARLVSGAQPHELWEQAVQIRESEHVSREKLTNAVDVLLGTLVAR